MGTGFIWLAFYYINFMIYFYYHISTTPIHPAPHPTPAPASNPISYPAPLSIQHSIPLQTITPAALYAAYFQEVDKGAFKEVHHLELPKD